MQEHRSALEAVTRHEVDKVGDSHPVTRHRYVCSCGHETPWYRDLRRAQVMRDNHALDGQLSMEV